MNYWEHDEYKSLLRGLILDPLADLPRLVLADWLMDESLKVSGEDHDILDFQAIQIRDQIENKHEGPINVCQGDHTVGQSCPNFFDKEESYFCQTCEYWKRQGIPTAFLGDRDAYRMHRGFIDQVAVSLNLLSSVFEPEHPDTIHGIPGAMTAYQSYKFSQLLAVAPITKIRRPWFALEAEAELYRRDSELSQSIMELEGSFLSCWMQLGDHQPEGRMPRRYIPTEWVNGYRDSIRFHYGLESISIGEKVSWRLARRKMFHQMDTWLSYELANRFREIEKLPLFANPTVISGDWRKGEIVILNDSD